MAEESEKQEVTPFRLAFRDEGVMVRCYIASLDSMQEATLLSCIPKAVLRSSPDIWRDWKLLMERSLVVICKEVFGVEPVRFEESVPPEHQ